jgi:hypothetical protein
MTSPKANFGNSAQSHHGASRSKHFTAHFLAILLSVFLISGCSLFSDQKQAPSEGEITEEMLDQAASAKAEQEAVSDFPSGISIDPSEETPEPKQTTAAVVELIWKVPSGKIDAYHLAYGYSKDDISTEVILKVSDLEQMDHPEFGPVFRYILSGVPSGKDVFFTLQAENEFGISEKTPPQEAKQE